MKNISILSVLTNMAMALLFGVMTTSVFGASALEIAGVTFGGGLVLNMVSPMLGTNLSFMAIQKEIWVDRIQENLYKGNEFITMSTSHDAYVDNLAVNVPQAGSTPTIEKNRSSFPGTIAERTDTVLRYLIDNFTTDPIRVRNVDQLQTSYDKIDSVLGEHVTALNERLGDECLYNWSPSASATKVLRTTGTLVTDNLPNGTATGSRRKTTKEDIRTLAKAMDLENIAQDGRILALPTVMYYELFDDADLLSVEKLEQRSLPNGVINRLFGFDIVIRPTVNLFDNAAAGVKKAIGSAEAITDCYGALAWSKYRVAKAQGGIDVMINEKVAEHYGDIMSAEVQFGATALRTDNKGVFALAQADA